MFNPYFKKALASLVLGVWALVGSTALSARTVTVTTLLSKADWEENPDTFPNTPSIVGIVENAEGTIYLLDSSNSCLYSVVPGGKIKLFAGTQGQSGYKDGSGAIAQFSGPSGLAIDKQGNLFIADRANNAIRKISPAGVVTTFAGQPTLQGATDGTIATALFSYPIQVAFLSYGGMLVVDQQGELIRLISIDGIVTTLAGNGQNAYRTPVDGQGTQATFYWIDALTVDSSDNAWVLDDGTLRKISPDGNVSTMAGNELGFGPIKDGQGSVALLGQGNYGVRSIASDTQGTLWFMDGTFLRTSDLSGAVSTVAGSIWSGSGISDGVGGTAQFSPYDRLFALPSGEILIADGLSVRKATPSVGPVSPIVVQYLGSSSVGVGFDLTLDESASFLGTAPFSYQWFHDGKPIAGATSPVLSLTVVQTTDAGAYSLVATNSAGSATWGPDQVTVPPPPVLGFAKRHENVGGSALWSITAGPNLLVTVGENGTILSSSDGRLWVRQNSGTTNWLVAVTYGNGRYVAVGDHGLILNSTDGTSWQAVASPTAQRLNGVAYHSGAYLAVGEAGVILSSSDGQAWTLLPSDTTGWLRGVTWIDFAGPWVVCGQNGYVRTLGGTVSNRGYAVTTTDFENVVSVRGNYLALGESGTGVVGILVNPLQAFFATQGVSTGKSARIRGVAVGVDVIFATGENGTILFAPNEWGPWGLAQSGTNANLLAGAYFGNTLYVVGSDETILQSEPFYQSRMMNLSTRAVVEKDAGTLISGFVINGSAPKTVLLRAVGPGLKAFGLTNTVATPTLTLFDSSQKVIAHNTGWETNADPASIRNATATAGAFPFAEGSGDCALVVSLAPGAYTAQVSNPDSSSSIALVEAYDADALSSGGSRAINLSTRGMVRSGENIMIGGFVIGGTASRNVLIRAVGPTLAQFGLGGLLAHPQIALFNQDRIQFSTTGSWSNQPNTDNLRLLTTQVGAFPLKEGSNDAVLSVALPPGAYTAQISGADGGSGLVLFEIYDQP